MERAGYLAGKEEQGYPLPPPPPPPPTLPLPSLQSHDYCTTTRLRSRSGGASCCRANRATPLRLEDERTVLSRTHWPSTKDGRGAAADLNDTLAERECSAVRRRMYTYNITLHGSGSMKLLSSHPYHGKNRGNDERGGRRTFCHAISHACPPLALPSPL